MFKKGNSQSAKGTSTTTNPAVYALAIIVLVVIIITFVIGPILSEAVTAPPAPVFGTYKGEDISYTAGSYILRAYEAQYDQLASQVQGRELGIQDAYTAYREAFSDTVFRLGLLDLAESARLEVSNEEITETIISGFQDADGNFSRELLQQTLNANPEILDEVRRDLIAEKVRNDLFAGLSQKEIEFITQTGAKQRVFELVNFVFDDYPESEIRSYVEESPQLFQRIELSSITLASKDNADQILEDLKSGLRNFEEVAEEQSIDEFASGGGARGEVWYYDFQQEYSDSAIVESVFALDSGNLSDVVTNASDQFVIFRADSSIIQPDLEEPSLISEARRYVQNFERGQISDYFRAEAEQFIQSAEELGWDNALSQAELSSTTTNDLAINYGDSPLFPTIDSASGNVLTNAGTQESLFVNLFSLEINQISDVIELRDGIVVARYIRESAQGDNDFSELYLPYLYQEDFETELRRIFEDPENLQDNFENTFQSIFLGG